MVTPTEVFVEVPANADYIFLSHLDTYFSDNGTGHVTISVRPLGDVNRSGDADFLDIPRFITILLAGSFQDEADTDGNGVVNFLDIAGFIEILNRP